eukprot:TRINITY_DN46492_c0_g1_i1.p2 TRINITY_DN46492_c0_g1~~TRINITY_DN46492_c0_g1_i1.p2  ORF type:complete len:205 (+),score=57.91 TRINITY_DN46492_c0_g1_i1:90-704(+)
MQFGKPTEENSGGAAGHAPGKAAMSMRNGGVDQRAKLFGSRYARNGAGGKSAEDFSAQQATRDAMERQNDKNLDELSAKISQLKDVTRSIDAEVKDSTSLLSVMSEGFDKASGLMKGTMNNLKVMMKHKTGSQLTYIAAITIALLFAMVVLRRLMAPRPEVLAVPTGKLISQNLSAAATGAASSGAGAALLRGAAGAGTGAAPR